MEEITFHSSKLKLYGILSNVTNASVGVVFLHGGGQSSTKRYPFLQEKFAANGIASLAFDFRGCGNSEGLFEDGGLKNRIIDAENAIEFFKNRSGLLDSQLWLWGSSMGGHIACRLTELHPNLTGIVLQSAAAYGLAAENYKLNQEFTDFLRIENSWLQSPAFTALAKYSGKKLVVFGEKDDVIPDGVKKEYKKLCHEGDEYIELPNGTHSLLNPQDNTEQLVLARLTDLSSRFIQTSHLVGK